MTEQQPMTAEQMAEIVQALEKPSSLKLDGTDLWIKGDGYLGENRHVFLVDLRSLLAEVQRLKADLAAAEWKALWCEGHVEDARRSALHWQNAYREKVEETVKEYAHLQAEVQRQQGEIERLEARMGANHLQALHNATLLDEQRDRADRLQAENDRLRDKLQQIDGQRQDAVQESDQLRQRLEEAVEALEWYGDVTEEEDSVYYCQPRGYGVMPSKVQVDGGQRALDFLKKLKGDRTDG